jgi:hypothetical protein
MSHTPETCRLAKWLISTLMLQGMLWLLSSILHSIQSEVGIHYKSVAQEFDQIATAGYIPTTAIETQILTVSD